MKCFIAMPFSMREADLPRYDGDPDHWNEVYRGLIIPAVRAAGLEPERDDEDVATRLIAEGVWRKLEQASLVLCDLSAYNPNVYLELGWALRADKRLVLIMDDLTRFSFDINQFRTYKYSHRLQPTSLARAVSELAESIQATLDADIRRYSLVERLQLHQEVSVAASQGSIEAAVLEDLVEEVRALAELGRQGLPGVAPGKITAKINSADSLADLLKGSTWRKKSGLEHLIFGENGRCHSNHAGHPFWRENEYSIGEPPDHIFITWSVDGMKSTCRFSADYSQFVEEENPDGAWYLLAERPHTPPWGV